MDIIIRRQEAHDAEQLKALYSSPTVYGGTLQLPYPSLTQWEKRLANLPDNFYGLVAESSGVIVGQSGVEHLQRPRLRHIGRIGMAVHQDYQRQGIGSQLLAAVIDLAENWLGVHRLELTVFTDNAAAIHLYQKHGFEIEGEARQFALRAGQYVNAYYMARIKFPE